MKKQTEKKCCAVFTGGGTGGHIYPGLAVVDELKAKKDCTVYWLGSSRGMDKALVEKSGSCDKFIGIPSGKLRRYFSLRTVTDIFRIIAGCIKAFFVLLKIKPDFVFSKGGFVSVPPCFAAKLLHIPVYTHECDFSPGLATRLNTKCARRIFVSYADTINFFPKSKQAAITVTGNPVRPVFYEADASAGAKFLGFETEKPQKPVLLVLGGSGGAKQINELVWQNISFLCEHFVVVHQIGASQKTEAFSQEVQSLIDRKLYLPFQFIYQEMPHVLAFADFVFSRSGANTLWEAAVLKKPLLLLPLEGAGTRGDQVENADYFVKQNAACRLVLKDADAAEALKKSILPFEDKSFRENLSANVAALLPKERTAATIAGLLSSENWGNA
ncbi:MAG: UDP-N-acetylglucosamine--N-acetylmuramyl-(pentapeptide) pyrophosphoryl-undecaprenol N-acetylglucosamine transferase [Treponemataceae bacterium]|nr:UDP-N-acetylglucosamine--N-acetylmuramyl-(pentapeptide) pyrophosphoryl-undecaprenol N-acetylglucosamine transferase [Treponemataceae bacterium]